MITNAIQLLARNEIDDDKWDSSVRSAANKSVYGLSWYLDGVFSGWQGLVLGDYLAVMPFFCKRKLGIPYLVQPYFCQHTGVYSPSVDSELVNLFFNHLPSVIRIRMSLDGLTAGLLEDGRFSRLARPNFILPIRNRVLGDLAKDFSKNTVRNVHKSLKQHFDLETQLSATQFLDFVRAHVRFEANDAIFSVLETLVDQSVSNRSALLWGCRNASGELVSTAFFVKFDNCYYYLISASSPEGYRQGALYYIFYMLLGDLSGTDAMIDFEGSSIPGVARFFRGWGADEQFYHALKYGL